MLSCQHHPPHASHAPPHPTSPHTFVIILWLYTSSTFPLHTSSLFTLSHSHRTGCRWRTSSYPSRREVPTHVRHSARKRSLMCKTSTTSSPLVGSMWVILHAYTPHPHTLTLSLSLSHPPTQSFKHDVFLHASLSAVSIVLVLLAGFECWVCCMMRSRMVDTYLLCSTLFSSFPPPFLLPPPSSPHTHMFTTPLSLSSVIFKTSVTKAMSMHVENGSSFSVYQSFSS